MKRYQLFRGCLLLTIACCLFSCEKYEPEGEYFKEVIVEEPAPMQIKLNPATDTLIGRGESVFSFEVPEQVRQELGYRLFLGTELLEENPYPPDMIFFDARYRQDGHYKLKMELYVKSNTGSLADKVSMDFFVYEYTWVLKIDNRSSSDYPIHQFLLTEEEGRIKLSWPEYDLPDFLNYEIYIRETGGRERSWSIPIPDPKVTHFYDDSFVGGSYTYNLQVSLNEYPSTLYGSPQSIEAPFPQILKQEQKEEAFHVAWSSCLYPENFEAYEIYRQEFSGIMLVYSSTDIDDTTAVLPAGFGTLGYQLHTRSKGSPEGMQGPLSDFTLTYGLPHTLPAIPSYLAGEKAYLLLNENILTKFDAATLEPLLSRYHAGGSELSISDNGEYIYHSDGRNFIRIDPGNLEEMESISVESLIGYGNNPQDFSFNNQHQLLFTGFKTADWSRDSMTLVDMNSRRVLQRRDEPDLNGGKLSNDGHFFLQGYSTLIDLEHDHTYQLEHHAQWLPHGSPRLLYNTENNIVIMDPETRQVLKEIPTTEYLHNLTVDLETGYVGGYGYREGLIFYQIYNIETGELLKDIGVNSPYVHFMNSTLFTSDAYLPLLLP